jgi:hypothetical protein
VKEQLLAARVPNEAVASIPNDSRDRAGFRHVAASLLPRFRTICPEPTVRSGCSRSPPPAAYSSVGKDALGRQIAVGIYASQASSACREPYTGGAPNGAIGEAGEEQADRSGLRSARPFSGDWPAWRWAHGHAER